MMSASGDIVDECMLSPDDVQDGIAQGKFELKQEEGEPPKKKLKKALKEEEKISEHGEIWASAALITKGFRITKIATQWNTIHDHVHQILSFESQDSKSVPSDLDYMLKQPSLRIHSINSVANKYLPERTMNLDRVPRFLEFFPTDTASSNFSVSDAKETDAGISYAIKHQDISSTAYKVECVLKFTCQFQGIQETMEIDS